MLKRAGLLGAAIGWLAVSGLVQATPISVTAIETFSQGNLNWQDIAGVSYTWADGNTNGVLEVGETVTFTVDMHKNFYGTHAYDALKVWIDETPINPPSSTLLTKDFIWDYNAGISDYTNGKYSWKPWNGGDKYFSFDYTFDDAGTYDLTASVMCSRDLSGLTYWPGSYPWNDAPSSNDWAAWKQNVHQTTKGANNSALQGETERYQLTVATRNVPEPGSASLMLLGLASIAGVVFVGRKK